MFAYIGCRTTRERNARGEGISVVKCHPDTGALSLVEIHKGWENPSYLTLNKAKRLLYTVHGDGTQASAFSIDAKTGLLNHINSQSTQGKNPVHLALSPNEQHLIVSNHVSSSLAVLPVEKNGALGELSQLITLEGEPGPHRKEQPFAKPHFNPFDPSGRFVAVPDKGLNKIFTIPFRNGELIADEMREVSTRETAGPRNTVFHPRLPYCYTINELDSTVTAYRFDAKHGSLQPFQIISGLSEHFTGDSRGAGIQLNRRGDTLYTSHRGADTIAVMSIDQHTGDLTLEQSMPCQGKTPRFFTLDPSNRWLYALNEDSDSIECFKVAEKGTGLLSATGQTFHSASPVCMVFGE